MSSLWVACAPRTTVEAAAPRLVTVAVGDRVVAETDPAYLSVTLDISQVVGGRFWGASGQVERGAGETVVPAFDFSNPVLLERARALGPAYLRIGGTEADTTLYQLGEGAPATLPPGFTAALTAEQWEELNAFASSARMPLVFTLAAGPAVRRASGGWDDAQARALVRHARARGDRVALWELGNEVNAYPVLHGLRSRVGGRQYAADLETARRMLDEEWPQARLAGPASAYWPAIGEPLGILPTVLREARGMLDVISWHYYPQQSRRCPAAVRRAGLEVLLTPGHLAEVDRWATQIEHLRVEHEPGAEVWMTETGNAQCGGEPGVSSRFASSLWWVDHLGRLARQGTRVVARQTLVGSDYGLLEPKTLAPRPDFHASLLWKRHMGPRVLSAWSSDPSVTAYAHCAPVGEGTSVALVQLGREPRVVSLGELRSASGVIVTAPALDSRELHVNGTPAAEAPGPDVPLALPILLPPRSIAFLRLPFSHPACRLPHPRAPVAEDAEPAAGR